MKYPNFFDYLIILICYFITHGLLLLNRGVFWDDWVLFNTDSVIIHSRFEQMGFPILSFVHTFFLSIGDGILPYRIAVFIFYLVSSLFLYSILKNIRIFPRIFSLFFVLLFVTLPMNGARITLICMPYALSLMLFVIGFWCFIQYYKVWRISLFILGMICSFFSFFGTSTLIAYLIPLGYIYFQEFKNKKLNITVPLDFSRHYLIILSVTLPLFFILLKIFFWSSYGLYKNYNHIKLQYLFNIPGNLILYINNNFFETIRILIPDTFFQGFFIVLSGSILFLLIIKNNSGDTSLSLKKYTILLITGIYLFILAAFPYLLTEKIASYFDWDSRHQMFIPFGFALIIISLAYFALPRNFKYFFLSLIITSCILATQLQYIECQKDWLKQDSIMEQMKLNSIIKNNSTFIFKDEVKEYNAFNRVYSFYEYSGWMKWVFGDESRLGVNSKDDIEKNSEYLSKFYNLGDYTISQPQVMVTIRKGSTNLNNPLSPLYIQVLKYIDQPKYNTLIKDIVQINCTPIRLSTI